MLLQQFAQVFRLGHRPRKPVKHKTVRTIRPLDALPDHLQHQGIRNQVAALHDRLGLYAERRALADMLAKHVTRRKVRHAVLPGQFFCLRALPRTRRPEKNHGAVQFIGVPCIRSHPGSLPLPPTAQPALPSEPFVVPHDQLCLQLLHGIHGHAHYDQ